MKYLIISASLGEGHVKAGEALQKKLETVDNQIKHLDILDYIGNSHSSFFSNTYHFLVTKSPFLWGVLYKITNNYYIKQAAAWCIEKLMKSSKIKTAIEEYNPDKIICTHFLPPYLISSSSKITIPITILITDYGIHALWLPKANIYRVATSKMRQKLIKRGIRKDKIKTKEIPTDPKFDKTETKEELKKELNVKKPVVLILGGGQGMLNISKITDSLFKIKKRFSLVAIAGKNKNLEQKIKQKQSPKNITYKPIGWTDQIDKYMKVANLVVSKPGGMTTTECIRTSTPIVAIDPIPGQEEKNLNYILENNFGYKAKNLKKVNEIARKVISN